ncbi:TPA: thiopeptide-type bacteriocin biosynthesis protein [Streptococcus suis]|nr:thiopeptide-type bacteriocin biosynthesis protein [Streptococcus suis]
MIDNAFFVREPLLPVNFFFENIAIKEEEEVLELLTDRDLYNAISYVAPTLLGEVENYYGKKDKKRIRITESIFNFASRSVLRPTPFGLFSSIGEGEFSSSYTENKNKPLSNKFYIYNVSMEWFEYLVSVLEDDDEIFQNLELSISPMILIEGDFVFVLDTDGNLNSRAIEIVPPLKYILDLLNEGTMKVCEVITLLQNKFNSSEQVIRQFLKEINLNKIVYTNLRPTFPYNLAFKKTLEYLCDNYDSSLPIITILLEIDKELSRIHVDRNYVSNLMMQVTPNFKEELFHVDSLNTTKIVLKEEIKYKIQEIEKVYRTFIQNCSYEKMLENITNYFYDRYNINDEVPLIEFLYSESSLSRLKLDFDLELDQITKRKLAVLDRWIERKLSLSSGDSETLEIDENLLSEIRKVDSKEQLQENTDYCLVLDAIGENLEYVVVNNYLSGCKLSSLMGRFAYLFPKDSMIDKDYKKRQLGDGYLDSEIITWSRQNLKKNNLFSSKKMHEFSIRCSAINVEKPIELSDIVVGFDGDSLYIKSKSYNKKIVPYLENMVNLEIDFTRIEKFLYLVSLQNDTTRQSLFALHTSNRVKIPRITYQNVVFARGRYKLLINYFSEGIFNNFNKFIEEFKLWKIEHRVPDVVGVNVFGDIQFYCLKNHSHLRCIYKQLKKDRKLLLEEFPAPINNINSQDKYIEYVFPVSFEQKYSRLCKQQEYEKELLDDFAYNDSAYIKIYTREIHANKIIKELLPLVSEKYPDYPMFFIKYRDPDFHLRIRVLNLRQQKYRVIKEIVDKFTELGYIGSGIISGYVVDNYIPELNRYGGKTCIPYVHDYFHKESLLILDIITKLANHSEAINDIIIKFIFIIFRCFYTDLYTLRDILNRNVPKIRYNESLSSKIKNSDIKDFDVKSVQIQCKELKIETRQYIIALEKISKMDLKTTTKDEFCLSIVHMFINRIGDLCDFSEEELYKITLGIITRILKTEKKGS